MFFISKYPGKHITENVNTLSPMGTFDTHSYEVPKYFRWGTINMGLLKSLYPDTNIGFDEFIKTLIINKKGIVTEPEKCNDSVSSFDTTFGVNKICSELLHF